MAVSENPSTFGISIRKRTHAMSLILEMRETVLFFTFTVASIHQLTTILKIRQIAGKGNDYFSFNCFHIGKIR